MICTYRMLVDILHFLTDFCLAIQWHPSSPAASGGFSKSSYNMVHPRRAHFPITRVPHTTAAEQQHTHTMATRSERSETKLFHSPGDHLDDNAMYSVANVGAETKTQSATAAEKPRQREDDSYYLYTSGSSPPPPPRTGFKKDETSASRNTSDQYDIGDDDEPPLLTLKRPISKQSLRGCEDAAGAKATSECLGLQMELRACLDANDNRESVCMWHFRMWQSCKKEQQQPLSKFGF